MAPASPRKRIKPNPESEEPAATEVQPAQIPLPIDASLTKGLSNTPSNDATNNPRDYSNREVRLGVTLEGYADTLPT
jgi:hypothetical protein